MLIATAVLALWRLSAAPSDQNIDKSPVVCDSAYGRVIVRSIYKVGNGFDIFAESPRRHEKLKAGCKVTQIFSDIWVQEQINPEFSHHDVIISCTDAHSASSPLVDTTCDLSLMVSSAAKKERKFRGVRHTGVVGCVAPLFGTPAQNQWKHWLVHAQQHYSRVIMYVVADLDATLRRDIERHQDIFQLVRWDMLLRSGDLRQVSSVVSLDHFVHQLNWLSRYHTMGNIYKWLTVRGVLGCLDTGGFSRQKWTCICKQVKPHSVPGSINTTMHFRT